ncbi:MAG: hypothetical protein KatS3mg118_2159 [Paracoccaceae bacterium]|nr:MAG: hypothetical protein KatS3mg118_2159 [Paracoccaceae bacterium]
MHVVITGAGGFLGNRLARALAERGRLRGAPITALTMADLSAPEPVAAPFPVRSRACDVAQRDQVDALLSDGAEVIFHLAAIVSGQAEAEFDLGMAVNLTGSLNLFQAARALGTCPVVVFTSSIAVYGGEAPDPITDTVLLNPQTSYGAQKAAAEMILTDMSRRGFIDGRGLRLPSITIRPGRPNRAASSFMSSIFREPLQGQEAVCPVPPDYVLWALSPRRCIENLIHGAELPGQAFGPNRCLALPGRSYTIGEMVEAMRRVAGEAPVRLIRWEVDPELMRIVADWRGRFAVEKALRLGFVRDESFEDNVRQFLSEELGRG